MLHYSIAFSLRIKRCATIADCTIATNLHTTRTHKSAGSVPLAGYYTDHLMTIRRVGQISSLENFLSLKLRKFSLAIFF